MRYLTALFALATLSVSAIAATPPGQTSIERTAGKMQLAAADDQMPRKGKVLSSIDASIYTYVEISENGKTVWIAAPTVKVKKGDTIRFSDGAVMTNFFSKSLNRTFPSVIFVGKAEVAKK